MLTHFDLLRSPTALIVLLMGALVSCSCNRVPPVDRIPFKSVQGQPLTVDGKGNFPVETIRLVSPVRCSFNVLASYGNPKFDVSGKDGVDISFPDRKWLHGGYHNVGSFNIYYEQGPPRNTKKVLDILAIVESKLGRVDGFSRSLLKEENTVIAFEGKTRQGYTYAYYEFVTEPSGYMIGVELPGGTLVVDGGGYVRLDTIPGSLVIEE